MELGALTLTLTLTLPLPLTLPYRILRSVMANDADRGDNYLLYMVESLMAWGAVRSFELRR